MCAEKVFGEGGPFTIATSSSELSGREKGSIHICSVDGGLLRIVQTLTCVFCGAPGNIGGTRNQSVTCAYMWMYVSLCVAPLTVAHLKI